MYRQSEESRDERTVTLEPGQEFCDCCGKVIMLDQRRECAACGHLGCVRCMTAFDTEDGDVERACGPECELAYWEDLQRRENATHRNLQDFYARKIEEARKEQVAA